MMDEHKWAEYAHEEALKAVVRHLLTADDLEHLCADADIPVLIDATGQPVSITAARTYRDAGLLTHDRGVWLDLSDGSQVGLTVTVSRRPRDEVTLRPPEPPHLPARPRSTPHPPRTARRVAGTCGCACTTGGFCGGCGHAGCSRR